MRKAFLTLIAGLVTLPAAQAGITPDQIDQAASDVQPQVVEWRRWFHQNPELSNREFNTSTRIVEILRDMGLEPKTGIAHTGVTAIIEGGKPGPLVAIRTDIDALPVTEQTGLPFASTAKAEYNGQEVGVMHACGHDAHMAMLLGAAKVLRQDRLVLRDMCLRKNKTHTIHSDTQPPGRTAQRASTDRSYASTASRIQRPGSRRHARLRPRCAHGHVAGRSQGC